MAATRVVSRFQDLDDVAAAAGGLVGGDVPVWDATQGRFVPAAEAQATADARVRPLAAPATVRQRVRQDFPNPRANPPTNGFAHVDASASSASLTGVVNDADFGYCAEYDVTVTQAAQEQVKIGDPPGTWGVPIKVGQLAFGRVWVKLVSQPAGAGDCAVSLNMQVFQTDGVTQVSNRLIASAPRLVVGARTSFEGVEYALANAGYARLLLFVNPSAAGAWVFRIGWPQVVVDPDFDPAAYVDGSRWNGVWLGVADQSPSEGWADPPAAPSSSFYFGANDNAVSRSASSGNQILSGVQDAALLREAGMNLWRGGINPANAWPAAGGQPNWRNHELAPLFDELRARGMKACPIVGNATTWMTTDASGFITKLDPAQHAAWKTLYTSLVQTWPDVIVAVEFYNEPNLTATWNPIDPAAYTSLMVEMHDAIKAAVPATVFVGGAISRYYVAGGGSDATGMDAGSFLTAMYAAGAKGKMDAVSVHLYPQDPSTANPPALGGFSVGMSTTLTAIRGARHAAGDDATPIWVTELGAPTGTGTFSEAQQARLLLMLRGILQRAGDVGAVCVHTLTADSTVPANQRGYGLADYASLRRKPAFRALATGEVPAFTADPVFAGGMSGLALTNGDPELFTASLAYTAGFIIVTKVWVPRDTPIGNIHVLLSAAGAGLVANENAVAVINPQGAIVAGPIDRTAAWAAAGEDTAAIPGGPVMLRGGSRRWVWVAILNNGTTIPKFASVNALNANVGAPLAMGAGQGKVPGTDARVGYESVGGRTAIISLAGLTIASAYGQVPWVGLS